MGKALIEGDLVLAIDFDGTITTEPDMDRHKKLVLQPHCARVLQRMHEDGMRLILWTCRSGPTLDEAVAFLNENDLLHVFETFNDQLHEVNSKYAPHVGRKIGADVYYDDKSAMTTINWLEFEKFIYGEELAWQE